MFLTEMFNETSLKPQQIVKEFVWTDYEDMPMAARISLAETWISSKTTLLESNDPNANEYFINMPSDTPVVGKKYIVTLLALVNDKIVDLSSPKVGLLIDKMSDSYVVEFNDTTTKFPFDSIKDKTTVKTFFFKNQDSYTNFRSTLKIKFGTELSNVSIPSINEATHVSAKERILNPGINVGDMVYVKAPGYDYMLRTAKLLRIGPSGLATIELTAPLESNAKVPDYFKGATTLAVPPSWLHADEKSAWPVPEWMKKKQQQAESVVDEAKGLKKRVRIVTGSEKGRTGTIGEVRHGLYKGAPKMFTIDMDGGGNIMLPGSALRLIKSEPESGAMSTDSFNMQSLISQGR
jgi:hypothetical protein